MLLAVRSNERAAASVGINVAQAKLMAFAIAAFIAGIGGALTGYQQGTLTADGFATFTSLGLLAVVYVAGIGRISGAVFAGIMMSAAGLFVTFLDEHFGVGKYQTIVAGLALVITAVANPDGVMSTTTGKGPAVAFFKARDRLMGRCRGSFGHIAHRLGRRRVHGRRRGTVADRPPAPRRPATSEQHRRARRAAGRQRAVSQPLAEQRERPRPRLLGRRLVVGGHARHREPVVGPGQDGSIRWATACRSSCSRSGRDRRDRRHMVLLAEAQVERAGHRADLAVRRVGLRR